MFAKKILIFFNHYFQSFPQLSQANQNDQHRLVFYRWNYDNYYCIDLLTYSNNEYKIYFNLLSSVYIDITATGLEPTAT